MSRVWDPSETIGDVFAISGQLTVSGHAAEGSYLFREAAVPLAGTRALKPALEWWRDLSSAVMPQRDSEFGAQLHELARLLAETGHGGEAVRVMTLALRHLPTGDLRVLTRITRDRPGLAATAEIAGRLVQAGLASLSQGQAEGITLLAGGLRVGGVAAWAGAEARTAARELPVLFHSSIDPSLLKPVARKAYELHWLGHQEPAVRIGMLIPLVSHGVALGSADVTDQDTARVLGELHRLSEELQSRGYPVEAAEVAATVLHVTQRPRASYSLWRELEAGVLPQTGAHFSEWDKTKLRFTALGGWVRPGHVIIASRLPSVDVLVSSWRDGIIRGTSGPIGGPLITRRLPGGRRAPPSASGGAPARPAPDRSAVEPPRFLFVLEGEHAADAAVQFGTEVDLVFKYDVPSGEELARVTGAKLEELRQTSGTLHLTVVPHGLELREGPSTKVARFRAGRLVEPIRFPLRAATATDDESGVFVLFHVNGFVIYDTYLRIELVPEMGRRTVGERRLVRPIDIDIDDVVAAAGRRREFLGYIWSQKGGAFLTHGQRTDREPLTPIPSSLSDAALQTLLDAIRPLLEELAMSAVFGANSDPLWPDGDPIHRDAFTRTIDLLLDAGWQLYRTLDADPGFRPLLRTVESLPPDSLVQIWTDRCFLPWAILYGQEFSSEWSTEQRERARHPERLWGFRYGLECLTPGSGRPVRRSSVYRERFVTMCLNPDIDRVAPATATYRPVDAHREFYERTLAFGEKELLVGHDPTVQLLQRSTSPSTFIYIYCHGQAASPFAGQPNEELILESERRIRVNSFGPTGDRFYQRPIVFVNSCSSGAFSPLVFSSFLGRFRENGAEGMVATAFPVPVNAAAVFGQEVMRRYLGGTPIGDVLLRLRRELIMLGNPLGFFYTLHCPYDLRMEGPALEAPP